MRIVLTLFLLVLNLSFLLVAAGLTSLYFVVYKGTEDPIGILAVIPADVVFVLFGLAFFGLGKFTHISLLNCALPFIAIPGFTIPGLILGTVLGSSGWDWAPAYLVGGVFGAVMLVLTVVAAAASMFATRRAQPR